MKELACFFAAVLILTLGILIGEAIARYSMRREAIANQAAHWTLVDGYKEFAWGKPTD